MSNNKGHGGPRKNAGRKSNAESNGAVNRTSNLHGFFGLAPVPPLQVAVRVPPPPNLVVRSPEVETPTETEWQRESNHQEAMEAGARVGTVSDDATTTTRNTTKKKKKTSGQNRRKGLLKESIKLINAKYHEKAIKGVQSGVLRDNPSMVRHGIPRIDVRNSWKEFNKMAVFNWFPYELIPDFKPICGTYGLSDCMIVVYQWNLRSSLHAI